MKSAEPKTKSQSTGPKTAYGKACSSLNATKHGIYSKSPSSLSGIDEQATFKVAIAGLKKEHPYATGELGNFMLVQLAMLTVRQTRLWQLEAKVFGALENGRSPENLTSLESLRKYNDSFSRETDAIIARLQNLRPQEYEGFKAELLTEKAQKYHGQTRESLSKAIAGQNHE